MIRGIGTSKGIGMGRALIVESPQMEISVKKIEDTAAEQERYKKAKAQFIEETQAWRKGQDSTDSAQPDLSD